MELRNALFSCVLQGVYSKLEESVQSQSENTCVGCVFRKGRQWCPMCQLQPNKGKLELPMSVKTIPKLLSAGLIVAVATRLGRLCRCL